MPLPKAFLKKLPKSHSAHESLRILRIDFESNHQGREYDFNFIKKAVRLWKASGGTIFCAPLVMFIVQEQAPTVAEFHSVNGGTARDLTAGVEMLLKALAPHYDSAVTYYDNPRVNDLLKHVSYVTSFSRIDEGQDRTFEATFILRG